MTSRPDDWGRSAAGRPDKHDYATLDEQSWAVHGGNRPAGGRPAS